MCAVQIVSCATIPLTPTHNVQIMNCPHVGSYVDDADRPLLSKITDITLVHGSDPREATITFKFASNDYITDAELVKKFTVKSDAASLGSEESEWADDVETTKTTINWKSDEKNLPKHAPMKGEGGEEFEPGSFFGAFFENAGGEVVVSRIPSSWLALVESVACRSRGSRSCAMLPSRFNGASFAWDLGGGHWSVLSLAVSPVISCTHFRELYAGRLVGDKSGRALAC